MAGVAAEHEEAVLLWELAVIPVTLEQFWLVQGCALLVKPQ